jgi:uncharacterized protein with GYD domain
MPLFVVTMNWTDQGVKSPENIATRRNLASGEEADAFDVDVKQVLYTTGENDILMILKAEKEENVAKWALVMSSRGNVRTRTCRAFTTDEFDTMLQHVIEHRGQQ